MFEGKCSSMVFFREMLYCITLNTVLCNHAVCHAKFPDMIDKNLYNRYNWHSVSRGAGYVRPHEAIIRKEILVL